MGVDQRVAVLRGTSLFGGLADEPLRAVAEPCNTRAFKKGEIVFHQGDPGETLYVVCQGLIKVFVTSEDGDEVVLATLRPGDTFGELALIDGGPRSASASVLEPTTLVLLTRSAFSAALEGHPQIREALFKSLGRLLRHVLEYASDLVFLDLSGRVAKLLVGLSEERGEQHHEGVLLDLHLSQSDLARMVGGSRPTVNQILRSFEARGYISVKGKKILVRQPEALGRRAGI
ncbi:MAG: Crp/Fnr family transcriptional regulator [Actinomycetota bacterium]